MTKAIASLNQSQAADLAGLTIQGLVMQSRTADPPAKGANGYPPREYGEWLKRRHLRGMGVSDDGVVYDYEKERARLTKEQADRTALEVRELRGESVTVEWVTAEWGRQLGAMRQRLLSLPTKAAPRVRGALTDEEAAKLIEIEVLEALGELSDDGLDARTRARFARSQASPPAAASPDGKPVGRRTQKAVSGKRRRAGPVAD